jgi:hypothetical protein
MVDAPLLRRTAARQRRRHQIKIRKLSDVPG